MRACKVSSRFVLVSVFCALSVCALGRGTEARVDVSLDAASLNDLLSSMAPNQVQVSLAAGRSVTLLLENLRVTGFDPAAGGEGEGSLLTSLQLKVPELGLNVPVSPRLSLQFKENKGERVCYLRFEEVRLNLPITGSIDLAPLLPPLPLIAKTSWVVGTARGDVRIVPRLMEARMGSTMLRLGFDLAITPVAAAAGS